MSILPPEFADLEQFVPRWGGLTTDARMRARCSSDMPTIRLFYDAMTDRAEAIIAYLDQYTLDDLPPDAEPLLALLLALAQAHVAVEIHGQVRAPNTPWPNAIRIVKGLPVLG